mgnify:CR=1 FL=1
MSLIVSLAAAAIITSAPPLQVENNSTDYAIDEFYIADAGGDWGQDLLAGEVVEPGETFLIGNLAPGIYDVRLVDDTGASCELTNINFEEDPTFQFTGSDCLSN